MSKFLSRARARLRSFVTFGRPEVQVPETFRSSPHGYKKPVGRHLPSLKTLSAHALYDLQAQLMDEARAVNAGLSEVDTHGYSTLAKHYRAVLEDLDLIDDPTTLAALVASKADRDDLSDIAAELAEQHRATYKLESAAGIVVGITGGGALSSTTPTGYPLLDLMSGGAATVALYQANKTGAAKKANRSIKKELQPLEAVAQNIRVRDMYQADANTLVARMGATFDEIIARATSTEGPKTSSALDQYARTAYLLIGRRHSPDEMKIIDDMMTTWHWNDEAWDQIAAGLAFAQEHSDQITGVYDLPRATIRRLRNGIIVSPTTLEQITVLRQRRQLPPLKSNEEHGFPVFLEPVSLRRGEASSPENTTFKVTSLLSLVYSTGLETQLHSRTQQSGLER